jgi:hypothetical protein
MENEALTGLVAVAVILIGGIFFYGLLLRLVFPFRVSLFEKSKELLDRPDLSQKERGFINFLLNYHSSFMIAWIVPVAISRALWKKIKGEAPSHGGKIDRTARLVIPFSISLLAANPFAALVTMIILPFFLVAARLCERERPKQALRDAAKEVNPLPFARFAH